jgi:hypothetical protein
MNQKVYYISDWHITPGHYTFERHRYPQAYIELGPWYILNFKDINTEIQDKNNLIIANTPVHDELRKLHLINNLMVDNEVYIGIEGSVWDWCDWPAAEQQLYIGNFSLTGNLYNGYISEVLLWATDKSNDRLGIEKNIDSY